MLVKLNLEVEANKLAQITETKAILDDKFKNEYIITEITEDILIEEGYKFIGFSGYTKYPLYQKENIYGMFIGNSFRLGEGLLTTEEELRKEDEEENPEEISK
jgi:hypothetical protein